MKHYIIVKFSETVQEKAALYPEIETLFKKAEKIEGKTGNPLHAESASERPQSSGRVVLRICSLVFGGRNSRYFLKCAGKIGDVAVSDHLSHLVYLITAVG